MSELDAARSSFATVHAALDMLCGTFDRMAGKQGMVASPEGCAEVAAYIRRLMAKQEEGLAHLACVPDIPPASPVPEPVRHAPPLSVIQGGKA